MSEDRFRHLEPLARVIGTQLAGKPEHFITHPSERKLLDGIADDELREFARRHGWRVVRRIGGRQIEFYNDVSARLEQERAPA